MWSQASVSTLGMLAHWCPPKTATGLLEEMTERDRSFGATPVFLSWYVCPVLRETVYGTPALRMPVVTAGVMVTCVPSWVATRANSVPLTMPTFL